MSIRRYVPTTTQPPARVKNSLGVLKACIRFTPHITLLQKTVMAIPQLAPSKIFKKVTASQFLIFSDPLASQLPGATAQLEEKIIWGENVAGPTSGTPPKDLCLGMSQDDDGTWDVPRLIMGLGISQGWQWDLGCPNTLVLRLGHPNYPLSMVGCPNFLSWDVPAGHKFGMSQPS
ncbi:hypothetical protein K435DRAFT_812071 [Dendrothele bispora CBS 962.96]|uniref:Uncharacterized protein n=1 Tax=Dendrothele bispora (strain CBS 962.96) TaxID=1314807 RepID=A0A4S8KQ86_DENBC|nr:hypothetical protein K435DRAFT_812071 [Dendrothele bispora CBS 962.96]